MVHDMYITKNEYTSKYYLIVRSLHSVYFIIIGACNNQMNCNKSVLYYCNHHSKVNFSDKSCLCLKITLLITRLLHLFCGPIIMGCQNQLCAVPRPAAPKPALCLLLNRLCIGTKPAFSFWINISTVSEVRCDCQSLGLVARIEASILVFDTKPVLYRPVLDQIQFCSFDRRCKTCLDTKPVLYHGRFCSLTNVCQNQFTESVVFESVNQIIIGSDKGLRPALCLAIICTNAGLLLIESLGTHVSESQIWIKWYILLSGKRIWNCRLHNFVLSALRYNARKKCCDNLMSRVPEVDWQHEPE